MAIQETRIHTDAGEVMIAYAMIRGVALAETLTHLAVGSGPVSLVSGTLQSPLATGTVEQELGRTVFQERRFVEENPAGSIIVDKRYSEVARSKLIYLRARFLESEAQGDWSQFGIFGGGVTFLYRGASLTDVGGLAGDDRANDAVVLSGSYSPVGSQRITVTCSTGGGDGVAEIGWVSDGDVVGGSATVSLGVPVPIPGSGLALTFSGGVDGVLTQGAQWEIRGTRAAESASYAAGGVYDALTNPAGQVLAGGECFELIHRDPVFTKGAAAVDWKIICEVTRRA